MTDPIRALCAELLDELVARPLCLDRALIDRARYLLAEPVDGPAVPEGRGPAAVAKQPSDGELLRMASHAIDPYDSIKPGEYEAEQNCAVEVYGSELCAFARDVLARWGNLKAGLTSSPAEGEAECPGCEGLPTGHNNPCGVCGHFAQPAPPAEGEVAELVLMLHHAGDALRVHGVSGTAKACDRAAELLERQAAPVPVAGPTFRDAIQLAQGCHDYSGGYGGTPCADAFHAGIATVVSVLTKASSGPWDHQTQAVFAVGADLPLPAPAPVPVAVTERLPGPEDCAPWPGDPNPSHWCWLGRDVDGGWEWEQRSADCLLAFYEDWWTHWLPAHALPLPAQAGEVQP